MNETLDVMGGHRSIRRFKPAPIPEERVRVAVEAAQRAATSSNVQAYCAIRITDRSKRERLAEFAGGQAQVEQAAEFFVLCADQRRHRLICSRDGVEFSAALEGFLVAVIDATLFAQNLVVAFESMGYGTCYIGGLRNQLDDVDRLLHLPQGVLPLYGLCVGEPDVKPGLKPRLPTDAIIVENEYPDDERMLNLVGEYDRICETYYRSRGRSRDWSTGVARMYASPRRSYLSEYYRGKGASLD